MAERKVPSLVRNKVLLLKDDDQGCSVSDDNGGLRHLANHGCGTRLYQSWLSNADGGEKGTLVSEEQNFVVEG